MLLVISKFQPNLLAVGFSAISWLTAVLVSGQPKCVWRSHFRHAPCAVVTASRLQESPRPINVTAWEKAIGSVRSSPCGRIIISVFAKPDSKCECRRVILRLNNTQQLGLIVSRIVTTARNEETIYIPSQNLRSGSIVRKKKHSDHRLIRGVNGDSGTGSNRNGQGTGVKQYRRQRETL
jgi:hypothetical protein